MFQDDHSWPMFQFSWDINRYLTMRQCYHKVHLGWIQELCPSYKLQLVQYFFHVILYFHHVCILNSLFWFFSLNGLYLRIFFRMLRIFLRQLGSFWKWRYKEDREDRRISLLGLWRRLVGLHKGILCGIVEPSEVMVSEGSWSREDSLLQVTIYWRRVWEAICQCVCVRLVSTVKLFWQ